MSFGLARRRKRRRPLRYRGASEETVERIGRALRLLGRAGARLTLLSSPIERAAHTVLDTLVALVPARLRPSTWWGRLLLGYALTLIAVGALLAASILLRAELT